MRHRLFDGAAIALYICFGKRPGCDFFVDGCFFFFIKNFVAHTGIKIQRNVSATCCFEVAVNLFNTLAVCSYGVFFARSNKNG